MRGGAQRGCVTLLAVMQPYNSVEKSMGIIMYVQYTFLEYDFSTNSLLTPITCTFLSLIFMQLLQWLYSKLQVTASTFRCQ